MTRRAGASRTILSASLALAAVAAVAGCTADRPPTTQAETVTATTARARTGGQGAATSGFHTVNGHKLFLTCRAGSGPTVVYLNDLDRTSDDAGHLGARVQGSRFCSYDRIGTGVSGAALTRTTGADAVADLDGLLAAAKIETPVVLVGEGWGGLLAALYAASNPEQVAALVLSDPVLPGDWRLMRHLPDADAEKFARSWEGNGERVNIEATLKIADHVLEGLPDIPMRILQSADVPPPESWDWDRILADHDRDLQALTTLVPQAEIIESEARAPLTEQEPGEVADALAAVLEQRH